MLDKDIIRRIVRSHINEVRYCYNQALARDPNAKGRIAVQFVIGGTGRVPQAVVQESTMKDPAVGTCIAQAVRRWTFPKLKDEGNVIVTYPFILEPGEGPNPADLRAIEREARRQERDRALQAIAERREREKLNPFTGEMLAVMELVRAGKTEPALARAQAWRAKDPGDVLALLALGEVHEARKEAEQAARAYGSIVDLFPARADLRRYVGARLERLQDAGLPLAIDTFAKAVEQRPDHPASHRLYAYALARAGRPAEAFAAIMAGLKQKYPDGRFAGVDQILRDDAGILAAVWIAADPKADASVRDQLAQHGVSLADRPSLRFVLNWETDANDVDFHIHDGKENHAWYASRDLATGGSLYADVTTGYGPECFAIHGQAAAFPYKLQAHYYSRGPMGYGMGKLEVLQHDGKGGLKFDERPFVIMQDNAFVDLGTVERPL
jgi:tetratricopeptide (TPR) repeat protein